MSREPRDPLSVHMGFPRVSGDEPVIGQGYSGAWLFSPRERG